jgi:hypothetical protein
MNDERLGLPSASGAHRFVHCAISHTLESAIPKKETSNPLAAEGTLIHAALEREDGSELDMDQARIAEKLSEIDKERYQQWRHDFPINESGIELREERLFTYGPDNQPDGSAKADKVYIIGDHALTIDYKSGYKQVEEASRNWQGRLQALAVAANNAEVTHVRVVFAQFRLMRFYTECDYSLEDLKYALAEWRQAVWRSKQPDAAANPGPWCSTCRAPAGGAAQIHAGSRADGEEGERADSGDGRCTSSVGAP